MNEQRNHAPMNPGRDQHRSRTLVDHRIPHLLRMRLWTYALTIAEVESTCSQPREWKEAERC